MKLMTKGLEAQFKKMGSQVDEKDPIVLAHFFNPAGLGDWYATEFNFINKIFFGFVNITDGEWGSFSLVELEAVRLPFGLTIERDLHWEVKPFSKCNIRK